MFLDRRLFSKVIFENLEDGSLKTFPHTRVRLFYEVYS
jgi:hypothetical protein